MTVFQLLVHSCLILNFHDGSLKSATCHWSDLGLKRFEQVCQADGIKQMSLKADRFRCVKVVVN